MVVQSPDCKNITDIKIVFSISTLVLNTLTSKWSTFVFFCLYKMADQCPQIMNCSNDFCRMLSWKQSLMERRPNTLCYRYCVLKDSCDNHDPWYQRCQQFYMSDYSRPLITVYGQVARKSSRPKLCRPKLIV